ncbi:Polyprotein P3-like protein [Drosera capensis]
MKRLTDNGFIGNDPLKHWARNKVHCKLDIINPDLTIQDKPLKHVTPAMEDAFKRHVTALLEIRVIRPSKSRHRTMAIMVNSGTTVDPITKREIRGKERMVFNYRSVNDNTYKDQYSLPERLVDIGPTLFTEAKELEAHDEKAQRSSSGIVIREPNIEEEDRPRSSVAMKIQEGKRQILDILDKPLSKILEDPSTDDDEESGLMIEEFMKNVAETSPGKRMLNRFLVTEEVPGISRTVIATPERKAKLT